ncbi:glycosyltransferase family 4 protein [Marinicrinis lubricantis]|uniref:Glycosyltransferase family 4 protein n=1 Tax=Marinicrinis lubricantis TaxID=2086470 RepID=A0ABW1IT91_9BACL
MKILQALFFPPEQPGGVSSMVPYIQEQFKQMGWDMELFYLPKRIRSKGTEPIEFQSFDLRSFEEDPITAKYIQTMKDFLWWSKLRIKGSYDLIHAHHPVSALMMKTMFPNTPVWLTIHSSYENELLLNGKIERGGKAHTFLTSLYRELELRLDGIITVSQAFKRYLGRFMEQPERIKVIYNGFDQRRFKPIDHENHVPQLVSLCRLVPAKGLDVLLKACGELKRRGHEFVLHLIGDGPIRPELEQQAQEMGIYEDTIFYGYTLHPEQFMPFFDIFVLPSRAEAFGNVFAEAALCWLALIGTDIGGISEQIEHGKTGLLVPVNDADALADALERVVVDPELRTQLAKAAWEKATTQYTLDRVIEQLKTIYEGYPAQHG